MNNEQVELFITKHVNEDKDSFFIEDYDDEIEEVNYYLKIHGWKLNPKRFTMDLPKYNNETIKWINENINTKNNVHYVISSTIPKTMKAEVVDWLIKHDYEYKDKLFHSLRKSGYKKLMNEEDETLTYREYQLMMK